MTDTNWEFAAKSHHATVEAQHRRISELEKQLVALSQPILSAVVASEFDLAKALRKAYNFGQTYWQQADSDYLSEQKKSDQTAAKFAAFVEESVAALASAPAIPEAGQSVPALTVHLSEMRESNGRSTWEVRLLKAGDAFWDGYSVYSDTIKGRAEYEADSLKHFLGLGPEPDMLAYDTDAPAASNVEAVSEQGKYVPIAVHQSDFAQGWHPKDNTPPDPDCRAELDARGDDQGQGLDPYWKWGFRAGFAACKSRQSAPIEAGEMPELPKPDTHCWDEDTKQDVWSHSPLQCRAYGQLCRDTARPASSVTSVPLTAAQIDALKLRVRDCSYLDGCCRDEIFAALATKPASTAPDAASELKAMTADRDEWKRIANSVIDRTADETAETLATKPASTASIATLAEELKAAPFNLSPHMAYDIARHIGARQSVAAPAHVQGKASDAEDGKLREYVAKAKLIYEDGDEGMQALDYLLALVDFDAARAQQQGGRSMKTVTVDAEALRAVLQAFMGPSHHVMELWAIRSLPHSDVQKLIDQFNEQARANEAQK